MERSRIENVLRTSISDDHMRRLRTYYLAFYNDPEKYSGSPMIPLIQDDLGLTPDPNWVERAEKKVEFTRVQLDPEGADRRLLQYCTPGCRYGKSFIDDDAHSLGSTICKYIRSTEADHNKKISLINPDRLFSVVEYVHEQNPGSGYRAAEFDEYYQVFVELQDKYIRAGLGEDTESYNAFVRNLYYTYEMLYLNPRKPVRSWQDEFAEFSVMFDMFGRETRLMEMYATDSLRYRTYNDLLAKSFPEWMFGHVPLYWSLYMLEVNRWDNSMIEKTDWQNKIFMKIVESDVYPDVDWMLSELGSGRTCGYREGKVHSLSVIQQKAVDYEQSLYGYIEDIDGGLFALSDTKRLLNDNKQGRGLWWNMSRLAGDSAGRGYCMWNDKFDPIWIWEHASGWTALRSAAPWIWASVMLFHLCVYDNASTRPKGNGMPWSVLMEKMDNIIEQARGFLATKREKAVLRAGNSNIGYLLGSISSNY